MVAPINHPEIVSSILVQAQVAYEAAESRAARIYAEVLASFKITNASFKIVTLKKPEAINSGLLNSYMAYKLK